MSDRKIDGPGLWLVKYNGSSEAEVVRVIRNKNRDLVVCDHPGEPWVGGILLRFSEKYLEKVYRKIKEPS
jgi:hypothetical protein